MSFALRSALLGTTFALAVAAAPAAHASISVLGDTTLTGYDSLNYTVSTKKNEVDTETFSVAASTLLTNVSVNTGSNVTAYSYVIKNSSGAVVGSVSHTKPVSGDILSTVAYNLAAGTYTIKITTTLNKSVITFANTTLTSVSTVPLPAALPLFGSALVGVGLLGRRRRSKTATMA